MAANKTTKGYREPLLRVLGDGGWHTFPELFYAVQGSIAPDDATRQLEGWKSPVPDDIDTRIRYGKEVIVTNALSALRCEQQGFRAERQTKKYRLDPARMKELTEARAGARVAFRAITAVPEVRGLFETLTTEKDGMLNPSQRFWLQYALETESGAEPYTEEA